MTRLLCWRAPLALVASHAESRQRNARLSGALIAAAVALGLAACGGSAQVSHLCTTAGCHRAVQSVPPGMRAPSRAARLLDMIASRMASPDFRSKAPVQFRDLEYILEITNAGSSTSYTTAMTVLRSVQVLPNSSAIDHLWVVKPARFTSQTAWRHWKDAGSPHVPNERRTAYRWTEPQQAFSFAPQGAVLTYRAARELPRRPSAVVRKFRSLLGVPIGKPVAPAVLLRQYGFVLAVAPISPRARQALIRAMGSLSGLSVCGRAAIAGGLPADVFCARDGVTQSEVVLNPRNGVVLAVRERLKEPAALYPDVAPGDLVDSDIFSLEQNPLSTQSRRQDHS